MYTHDQLKEKTNTELRQIAKEMGIVGVSKKRKDIIIDKILVEQSEDPSESGPATVESSSKTSTNAPLTGVEFNTVAKTTNPSGGKGEKSEMWCRISSGATSQQFDVAGYTIADVMTYMKEVLNVTKTSSPIVNGEEVKYDYKIKPGDNIEFVKPAGSKG